jgi:hypothetical protein
VCYTLALYGLILFWIGASELLQPFNPLLKFALVKTVVFLTFWQVRGVCGQRAVRVDDACRRMHGRKQGLHAAYATCGMRAHASHCILAR